MQNPEHAEATLRKAKANFIGLGHTAICDPHWVNKVQRHETYDIVRV